MAYTDQLEIRQFKKTGRPRFIEVTKKSVSLTKRAFPRSYWGKARCFCCIISVLILVGSQMISRQETLNLSPFMESFNIVVPIESN